jgi:tetratricopeptide (TPR) repeat protein
MFKLRTLSREAIPIALEKADRYRLLKEPLEAQSICRDILEIDPQNQQALVTLLLALTDSFKQQLNPAFQQAEELLRQLGDQFCKAYYGGIICERRAKVHFERREPGSGQLAYEWFRKAMALYDQALNSCSPGNQDALLRWNTCARVLMQNPQLAPSGDSGGEQMLE